MALYFVRWFDPTRPRPMIRDFHSKPLAEAFRERLPYLSEPPKVYPAKPRNWAALRQADRGLTTPST